MNISDKLSNNIHEVLNMKKEQNNQNEQNDQIQSEMVRVGLDGSNEDINNLDETENVNSNNPFRYYVERDAD
jgi:hypothetical protein